MIIITIFNYPLKQQKLSHKHSKGHKNIAGPLISGPAETQSKKLPDYLKMNLTRI